MSLQSLPLLRILQLLVILFCCETIYLLFVTPTSFIITFYYYDYRKRYAVSLTVRKVVVMIFSSSSSFCCWCELVAAFFASNIHRLCGQVTPSSRRRIRPLHYLPPLAKCLRRLLRSARALDCCYIDRLQWRLLPTRHRFRG